MRDYAEDQRPLERAVRPLAKPGPSFAGERLSEDTAPSAAIAGRRETLTSSSVLGLQRTIGNARTTAYLQREEEKTAGGGRSPVHQTISGGGSPLDKSTRQTMEKHLGADFSGVRLHVDAKSSESVKAAAYTVGNDVVVHPNHFQPGTPSAQRTLAHELTHVVQQRSGPVDGTPAPGGIKVSDPSDRFEQEAERNAGAFARMNANSASTTSAASGEQKVQRLSLQREEEDQVQRLSLQREVEGEEEKEEG